MTPVKQNKKYVFVTGGVVSSLGKGIVASSLGRLLRARGYSVSIQKLDPYLNVDPGTMSPYQHGEVFVTEDGAETDLDLGHYERFIDTDLMKYNSVTSGRIYSDVISKERKGEYLGGTVQMVPHVTNEIKEKIRRAATESGAEVCIVEVGGTVGDIESLIFLEAIRQFKKDVGEANSLYIHVTLVPNIKAANELKTKPTQHSVEAIKSKGISPNILVLRCEKAIPQNLKDKLSLFTDVPVSKIIESRDCKSIYEVPLLLEKDGLANRVIESLQLEERNPDLENWKIIVDRLKNPNKGSLKVAVVGKYVKLSDAYISVTESIKHACAARGYEADLKWILSDDLKSEEDARKALSDVDAVCVPGGFGDRGVEGKIRAVKFAREAKIPYLGLCLGMQCVVIEFARNVVGLSDANSTEFAPDTTSPVIDLMPDQQDIEDKGGTMRLGRYPCKLTKGTKSYAAYNEGLEKESEIISERHRHRYEVNNFFRERLEEAGLTIAGLSPDRGLVEMVELKDHPWFVACQFHPEFKSRPDRPHPLFLAFAQAAINLKESKGKDAKQGLPTA